MARAEFGDGFGAAEAAYHPDERVRISVANRGDLPREALERLLEDPSPAVRRQALKNPQVDAATFLRFVHELRRMFVRNRLRALVAVPENARMLATAEDPRLVMVVARRSLDEAALNAVLARGDVAAARAMAFRLSVPQSLRPILIDHSDLLVASIATMNPSLDPVILHDVVGRATKESRRTHPLEDRRRAVALLRAAARNSAATPEIVSMIAASKRWDLRALALAHPALAGVGDAWVHDTEWAVRAAVAASRSTAPETLVRLSRDLHEGVRLFAAGNPSMPARAVSEMLRPPAGAAWTPASDVWSPQTWVRGVAVGNPNAPADAIQRLLNDFDAPPWVLANATRNRATSPELAEQIGTWLALGGAGRGSLNFDPRRCLGVPVAGDVDWTSFYRMQRGTSPDVHPLWPCRLSAMATAPVKYPTLRLMSRDPEPRVRQRVLDFSLPLDWLDEMRLDEVPWIARRAATAYDKVKAMRYWRRPGPNSRYNRRFNKSASPKMLGISVAAVIVLALMGNLFSDHNNGSSPPITLPFRYAGTLPSGISLPTEFTSLTTGTLDGAKIELGIDLVGSAAYRVTASASRLVITTVEVTVDGTKSSALGTTVAPGGSAVVDLFVSLFEVGTAPVSVRFVSQSGDELVVKLS